MQSGTVVFYQPFGTGTLGDVSHVDHDAKYYRVQFDNGNSARMRLRDLVRYDPVLHGERNNMPTRERRLKEEAALAASNAVKGGSKARARVTKEVGVRPPKAASKSVRQPKEAIPEGYVGTREAAELTGKRRQTVFQLMAKGKIEHVTLDGHMYAKKDALLAYFQK